MTADALLPVDRLLSTLAVAAKEAQHLEWSRARVSEQKIDTAWVDSLPSRPELAERLEAFVSRYGRLQDTIADKLLPRWLIALAERPVSQIETLSRAERLGVIEDVAGWLEARQLRNRLIHEYMTDSAAFAEGIMRADAYSRMLVRTYQRLREDTRTRLGLEV